MMDENAVFQKLNTEAEVEKVRREHPEKPIFYTGEYLQIKGRWFQVRNCKSNLMTLQGMSLGFVPPEGADAKV